jgi:predicted nucleic acid-binding protein
MNAVFDSNILIDYLKAIPQAKAEVGRFTQVSISLITWMEVMAGAKLPDVAATRSALMAFTCLPISQQVAERTFVLRRDRKLKLPDAIILATAQVAGVILVTRNTRDFSSADPQIRIPYQI